MGAVLGLAAFFLDWTGDGRGIDYIRPASRLQSGYNLPIPLTILAVGAAVAVGAIFLSAVARHSTFRWMGGIGGFVLATLPLTARGGYWFLWIENAELKVWSARLISRRNWLGGTGSAVFNFGRNLDPVGILHRFPFGLDPQPIR